MKLEQTFEVHAPADRVWAMMTDLASVAPCLPGAQLTDHGEDGTYQGTFTVKLGPTTASYRGRIEFRERDEHARRAVMHATGQDKRGQGGATATMITTVSENGDRSNVNVATDLLITGKLARFGRGGMIEDISNRLLADFATCLQAKLAAAPAPAAPPPPVASDAPPPPVAEAAPPPPVSEAAPPPPAASAAPPPPVAEAAPPPPAASAAPPPPGPVPAQPAANPVSGTDMILTAVKGTLRRNGPAIGVAAAAVVVFVGWRARRRAR